jgi:hypothetical protein
MKSVSNQEQSDFTNSKIIIEIVLISSRNFKVECRQQESSGHYPESIKCNSEINRRVRGFLSKKN